MSSGIWYFFYRYTKIMTSGIVTTESTVVKETISEAYPASRPNFAANNVVTAAVGQAAAMSTEVVTVSSKRMRRASNAATTGKIISRKAGRGKLCRAFSDYTDAAILTIEQ